MRKTLLASSLIFSILTLISPSSVQLVYAQYFQRPGQSGQVRNSEKQSAYKHEAPRKMDKEINLPDLPRYPGAKFISGEEAANNEQVRSAYTIDYSIAKNSESQIIPWYANVLSSGGWKINQQTSSSIDASNDKMNAHCNIFFESGDQKSSRLHVNYVVVSN
jgi:hypothetical protein